MIFDETALLEGIRRVVREEIATLRRDEPPGGDVYLTVRDAAKIASVHPQTVRSWIKTGRLASYGEGRLIRIRRADLDAVLQPAAPQGTVDFAKQARALRARHAAKRDA